MARSKRDVFLTTLGAGVLALAAGSLYRHASPRTEGSAPAMSETSTRTPHPAAPGTKATPAAPQIAAPEGRGAVRTDTLKIREVPEPGSAAPPEESPQPPAAQSIRFDAGGFAPANAAPPDGAPARQSYAAAAGAAPAGSKPTARQRASSVAGGQPAVKDSKAAHAPLSEDSRVAAAAEGLVAQARRMKIAPRPADGPVDLSKPADVRQAVLEQFALDTRVDAGVRQALSRLDPSAGIEPKRQAVADVLAAQGQPADEVSITNALARGLAPPAGSPQAAPEPTPQAVDTAINRFAAAYAGATTADNGPTAPAGPKAAARQEEPVTEPGPEYVPREPAPRGVADAYKSHAAAFAAAQKNFGVAPWDILALAQQETSFGKNMGHVPLPKGLSKRQADLAAAIKLDAAKQLPAPWQNLRGSQTGALGPFQFEPATQLSAGRGDPFDWNNQIAYSVPHLLILNGYKADDPVARRKAFGRYYGDGNPNGKYALSVAGHAEAIKPALEKVAETGAGH